MTKILLIGAPLSGNFGGPSLLSSTIKVLSNFIQEAEFTLLSPARTDSKLSETYGIRIVPYTLKSCLGCLLGTILNIATLNIFHLTNRILKEYETADVIIDIRGIIFADSLGRGISRGVEGIHLLIGKLLNKPVVKYTADMGPFRTKWNRFFARFYLNKIDLILARSEMTKRYLLELDITTPIHICPDTAFLLEPAPTKEINILSQQKSKKKTLVGISVSHITNKKERYRDEYATMMAKIANFLIQKLNAFVVLIPNEIFPNKYDDVCVAKRIYGKINDKNKVVLLMEDYPASELKGIIGKCDMLIGARYHSIVAATSMCIPTLATSWHHKYHEVMKLMGQEGYVCDIESLNFAELREKVDSLWENREKIKAKMASRIPSIKESVLSGGKVVKEMLDTMRG